MDRGSSCSGLLGPDAPLSSRLDRFPEKIQWDLSKVAFANENNNTTRYQVHTFCIGASSDIDGNEY